MTQNEEQKQQLIGSKKKKKVDRNGQNSKDRCKNWQKKNRNKKFKNI